MRIRPMIKYLKIILPISCLAFFACPALATEEPLKGLRYWKSNTPENQHIHLLQIDPQQLKISAAHANDSAQGLETVASIAKRHQAIAAINGGFFKMGEAADGLPAGILKIAGDWYGIAYQPRGAIGWSEAKKSSQAPHTLVDRLQTKTSVYINHQKYPIHAMNQASGTNNIVLYTEAFGKNAPTKPGTRAVVIQNNRVTAIETNGETPIPKDGYVYAIGAKAKFPIEKIAPGNPATVTIEVNPEFLKEHHLAWQKVDTIIGGAPLLIYGGKIIRDYAAERMPKAFIHDRYARTAVGLLKNGEWILAIVEKNALNGSQGMTIPELAEFMKKQKCEYAVNLDGGGSSTLYINNNVVNSPEGDEDLDMGVATLRPVSDAILILPKK